MYINIYIPPPHPTPVKKQKGTWGLCSTHLRLHWKPLLAGPPTRPS